MEKVKSVSATASDISHLMQALMPLAQIARYGNVRKTDVETVSGVIASMVARICAGLPAYCSALNDDAAQELFGKNFKELSFREKLTAKNQD